MTRNERLIRQLRLLQCLEQHRFGQTMRELRDRLVDRLGLSSLSLRTVRRDLEALQSAGFDVRTQKREQDIVWVLGPFGQNVHEIGITATELLALSLGRDLLFPLAGTIFWEGIESFWKRVQEKLPEGVRSHYLEYSRFLRVQGVPAKSYGPKKGILDTIQGCIREHRVLRAVYRTVGKPERTRHIEPYGVVIYQGSVYVIGGDADLTKEAAGRIKQWKLDRFESVERLDRWFAPPDDFDLDRYLAASIGPFAGTRLETYRVRVDAQTAPWVLEEPWHADQTVEPQSDGSVVITLEAAHPMAVIPRVLALGAAAELLEPETARRDLAEIAERIAARYR